MEQINDIFKKIYYKLKLYKPVNSKPLAWVILGLGLILSLQYVYYIYTLKNPDILWGNIKGVLRIVYIVSIFLAIFSYIYLAWYLLFKINPYKTRVLGKRFYESGYKYYIIAFLIILIFSLLWLPVTLNYLSSGNKKIFYRTVFILSMVALGSIFLALLVYQTKFKNMEKYKYYYYTAIVCSLWFMFHVTYLDAYLWPQYFI